MQTLIFNEGATSQLYWT